MARSEDGSRLYVVNGKTFVSRSNAEAWRRHAALDPDSYPFILKAAHELAVVGRDDQREIEAALEQELLNRGMRPRYSPKQAAKNRE